MSQSLQSLSELLAQGLGRSFANQERLNLLLQAIVVTPTRDGQAIEQLELRTQSGTLTLAQDGWLIEVGGDRITSQEWTEVKKLVAALQAVTPLPPSL